MSDVCYCCAHFCRATHICTKHDICFARYLGAASFVSVEGRVVLERPPHPCLHHCADFTPAPRAPAGGP